MKKAAHEQIFPMKLPSSVIGRRKDRKSAQEDINTINHFIFPPGFKQALGLFGVPRERQEVIKNLQKQHTRSSPEWIIFTNENDEPVGWFYGYMEDEETYFIDTIGFVPAYRGKGIYTAFLKHLISWLRMEGYERIGTTHLPNNRGALIADLKNGFNIVGMELHESHGPMVKLVCPLYEDRRKGFE